MTGGRIVAVFSGGGTGGHLYPALALAGALVDRRPDVRPWFIGSERGIEARVLPEQGYEHLLVPVEGFRRGAVAANVRVLALLLRGVMAVGALFARLRPRLVVVTGGYAGGPAGLLAVLTRTPLVVQEQNALPGITTRWLAFFADEVHLAFPEAVGALPRRSRVRSRITGNPVRPPRPIDRGEAARRFGLDPELPVLLVVGGSQGSEALNAIVLEMVTRVIGGTEGRETAPFQLLWATGPTHIDRIEGAIAELGAPGWIRTVGYIDDMPTALALTTLAVSRAGAMATSEFLAWGIPSILVPLPTAAADHQTRNARALAEAGAALHFTQQEVSGEVLWGAVQGLLGHPEARERMAAAARARGRPRAVGEMAGALERFLPPPAPGGQGWSGGKGSE